MGNMTEAMSVEERARDELRYLVEDAAIIEWREYDEPFGVRWVIDTGAVATRRLSTAEVWTFIHGYHVGRRASLRVPSHSPISPSVEVTE